MINVKLIITDGEGEVLETIWIQPMEKDRFMSPAKLAEKILDVVTDNFEYDYDGPKGD